MTLSLVSVIVPTYNRAKRIAKTLQSIIAQDYENLEIIVVNDGSTDNSSEVSEEVLKNSGRPFKIINHEKNRGVSAARNTGLKAAQGKYVCFCDSDDLLEKNFVSSLCNEAEEKKADLVFCKYQYYYEKESRFEPEHMFSEKSFRHAKISLWSCIKRKMPFVYVWNCIFNKDFLKKNYLKFCEKLPFYEDIEYILKSMTAASKISFVDSVLYTHVQNPESCTKKYMPNESKMTKYNALAMWRAGRCILRNTNDSCIKNRVFHVFIINAFIKQLTVAAETGNREYYDLKLKNLRHKKMRKIILSSVKYIFTDPELFLKALMVLYCPNFYYRLRRKK